MAYIPDKQRVLKHQIGAPIVAESKSKDRVAGKISVQKWPCITFGDGTPKITFYFKQQI